MIATYFVVNRLTNYTRYKLLVEIQMCLEDRVKCRTITVYSYYDLSNFGGELWYRSLSKSGLFYVLWQMELRSKNCGIYIVIA